MRTFALAVLLAGCGRYGFAELPDGADVDALQRGPVTVTTNAIRGFTVTPENGVPIVVTDETGAVREMATSNGSATVTVERGWTVTALFPTDTELLRAKAYTFAGVVPGDALEFRVPKGSAPLVVLDYMTFDLGAIPNASVTWGCGRTTAASPLMLPRFAECGGTTMFDGIVMAYGEVPPVYAVEPITWVGGTTHTFTAYNPMETFDVTVTGIPSEVTTVNLGAAIMDPYGLNGPAAQSFTTPTPTTSASFYVGKAAGTSVLASYGLDRDDLQAVEAGQSHTYRAPTAQTGATFAVDDMPYVTAASIDFAQPAITLQTTGTGPVVASIFAIQNVRSARAERTVDWLVIAPGHPDRVELPRLPSPYAEWAPMQGDDLTDVNMTMYRMDIWPTYREVVRVNTDDVWATATTALRDLNANQVSTSGAYIFY